MRLTGGGEVTNGSSGNHRALISGEVGIAIIGAATVTNFGVITGRYGDAVVFSSAADRFVAEAGSRTNGVVIGDGGILELATGTGTITGLGETTTISGSMAMTATGFGVYALDAGTSWVMGGADTLAAGATLFNSGTLTSMGSFTIAGAIVNTGDLVIAAGTVSIAHSLVIAGPFAESAGATIDVAAGDRLTLTGTSMLAGAIDGPGSVSVGAATINALTLNGATLIARGPVSQSGTVSLGDTGSGVATIDILKDGIWEIGSGSIVEGAGRGVIRDFGLLIKDSGAGVSTVGVTTYDNGTIEVATGALDFTQRLFGTGALIIETGATLQADRPAAATLTVSFAGTDATLSMRFARNFAATISGFVASDVLDLLETKATGASVNGHDQLVIVNGNTIVATLQLSGSYEGTTVHRRIRRSRRNRHHHRQRRQGTSADPAGALAAAVGGRHGGDGRPRRRRLSGACRPHEPRADALETAHGRSPRAGAAVLRTWPWRNRSRRPPGRRRSGRRRRRRGRRGRPRPSGRRSGARTWGSSRTAPACRR